MWIDKINLSQEQIDEVFNDILANKHSVVSNPKGFVLGGQPGAGKSNLIKIVKNELEGNVIVMNGDDFRKYHSDYKNFQLQGSKDSAPKR
ncbi:AAA family ATPase [Campylobacter sp. LR291e]|uniref:zeta toxin family protein n=1 Tax=Campylobacter sp. LR291e TaxID=2593546 RepID=UPI0012390186|nr:zeta toxin family protein [Campylobacter sp. LR291e]KAA6234077.1 AAA family ATPase [Campylobacter sp. LR291e]